MDQKPTVDVDYMPQRGPHHRRAHSDTAFRLDDLLLFDPSDLDLSSLDLPSTSSNPNPPRAAVDSSDDSSNAAPCPPTLYSHRRSLSVDSDFFDGLGLTSPGEKAAAEAGEKRVRHRHSNSMDGAFDFDSTMAIDGIKKAMGPDRLAELALIDPKRAKRILANRQSAARSKERKVRYTNELERKVQTLQTEATNLSAQVTMLQRDTSGLTSENKELKLRLQAMEQQAKLRDALSEALREELQQLKITAAQISAPNGNPFNQGLPPQFPHQSSPYQIGVHQNQQQQQQQQHIARSMNNYSLNGQLHPGFMDFNQRV